MGKYASTLPKKKGTPRAPRCTAAQLAERVQAVLRIRLDGAEFHDIAQYALEQKWNLGERQLWEYIAKADALLTARRNTDRDKLLAWHHAARLALYARAVSTGDYGTARKLLADEARLRGLYPAGGNQENRRGHRSP
jgi:hypothetical protein